MRENRLRWFGRNERRNDDNVMKKIDEIRVERNRREVEGQIR